MNASIIAKLQALQALANNPAATQGEIDNALRAIDVLVRKHQIDLASINTMPADDVIESDVQAYTMKLTSIERILADMIAINYNTKMLFRGAYRGIRGWVAGTVSFIGLPDDVALCVGLFRSTRAIMYAQCDLHLATRKALYRMSGSTMARADLIAFKNGYYMGFITGLQTVIKVAKREHIASLTTTQKNDLAQYGLVRVDRIQKFIETKYAKIIIDDPDIQVHDTHAYKAGYIDGKQSKDKKLTG